jgi:hypothetical protein
MLWEYMFSVYFEIFEVILCRIMSSGIWDRVVCWNSTDVSEEHVSLLLTDYTTFHPEDMNLHNHRCENLKSVVYAGMLRKIYQWVKPALLHNQVLIKVSSRTGTTSKIFPYYLRNFYDNIYVLLNQQYLPLYIFYGSIFSMFHSLMHVGICQFKSI